MAYVDAQMMATAKKFLRQLKDQGIHVECAYLFGSHAKGTPDEWSDIDVAIVSPDISEDRLEERIRLTRLSSKIDSRIDPVPFSPSSFVDEDPLVWEIKRAGIRIDTL
jgi:predicted nucleotidyltransferase